MRIHSILRLGLRRLASVALTLITLNLALCAVSMAQTETLMYSFTGASDGAEPNAGLVADSAGNYYGSAFWGGSYNSTNGCQYYGCGVIFKLSPDGLGGWTQTVIYTFTGGADGGSPVSPLIFDAIGNLYGTTWQGGTGATNCPDLPVGCGVVFKLSPTSSGPWTESVLYSFKGGNDGMNSAAPVTFDAAGNLYGTAPLGGPTKQCADGIGCGEVFKLNPNGSGGWTYSVIHFFTNGKDGGRPDAAVLVNASGDIFATTTTGGGGAGCGQGGCGTAIEFLPNGSGGYTGKLLHAFSGGRDGSIPEAGLIADAAGNLYGAALEGGSKQGFCKSVTGCGLVYELSPQSGGNYKPSILYTFRGGADGYTPRYALTFDAEGNLYGETDGSPAGGPDCGFPCGAIYKLTPNGTGGWTQSVVYSFQGGAEGYGPASSVVLDAAGNIFGTTYGGGVNNGLNACGNGCGVAYEITP